MKKKRGGYWQPVTGGVEEGEMPREGAIRELYEETGIVAARCRRFSYSGFSFQFESRWGGMAVEKVFFAVLNESEAIPQIRLDRSEHTDYKWVKVSNAKKILSFHSNRQGLNACIVKKFSD